MSNFLSDPFLSLLDGPDPVLQVVLKRAHNAAGLADEVNNMMIEFANRGFRSLGLAMAEGDGEIFGSEFEFPTV